MSDRKFETPFEVGYGRPPIENRFKPGMSGNPKGRPRTKTAMRDDPLRRANQLLLEEAYRPVKVRDGDETIEIPAIQAVFRAMLVGAMKGDRHAQRASTAMITDIEKAEDRDHQTFQDAAMEYKFSWEAELEEAELQGRSVPQPVPHPADIFFDSAGNVHICGPLTDEEKVDWDRRLEHREDAQAEVSYWAAEYRRAREPEFKASCLEGWKDAQSAFYKIDDNLPRRYRKNLRDRCFFDGTCQPGSQTIDFWPNKK